MSVGRNASHEVYEELEPQEIHEPEPDVTPELQVGSWVVCTPKTLSERTKEWLEQQPQVANKVPAQREQFGNKAKKPKVEKQDDYWMDWKRDLITITPDMTPVEREDAVLFNALLAIAQKTAKKYTYPKPRENYMDRHRRITDVKGFIMAEFQGHWDELLALPRRQMYSRAKTMAIRDAINFAKTGDEANLDPITRVRRGRRTSAKYGKFISINAQRDYEPTQVSIEADASAMALDGLREAPTSPADPNWNAPNWQTVQLSLLEQAIDGLPELERIAIDMKFNSIWNLGESLTLKDVTESLTRYFGKPFTFEQTRYALKMGLKHIREFVAANLPNDLHKAKLVSDLELEERVLYM